MKRKWSILLVLLLILVTSIAYGAAEKRYVHTWVKGRYDKNGVWVAGHYKKTERKDGMYAAADKGNLPRVKELVESGASVNVKVIHNNTPLHAAASRGHLEVVKYLVENGAEVNALNTGVNMTPLDFASQHKDVAEYLKSKGGKRARVLRKNRKQGTVSY